MAKRKKRKSVFTKQRKLVLKQPASADGGDEESGEEDGAEGGDDEVDGVVDAGVAGGEFTGRGRGRARGRGRGGGRGRGRGGMMKRDRSADDYPSPAGLFYLYTRSLLLL